jgi:tetratricopeptide (TPR) repeat protein
MNRSKLLLLAALSATTFVGCKSSTPDRTERVAEAVKVDPSKSVEPAGSVHLAAGDLAFSQQNVPEAVAQYRKALEMNPNDDAAMYRLATVFAYAKQFNESIAMWKRYNAATGDSAPGLSNLGRTYELAGRWREAEAAYVSSIRKEGSNATARINYGIMLAKRDRIDEATEQLSKVLRPAEVEYNLGSVFEIREDFTSARERYARAIELDPGLVAAKQRLDALRTPTLSAAQ